MFEFLDRFYEFSKRHRYLYPLFVLVKLVLYLVPLVRHEGPFGAVRWLSYRLKFALQNRRLLNDPHLPDQPIKEFRSRHGFALSRWIEYVIYDEIFLEGVYMFPGLREKMTKERDGIVLDFGTHHGLFTDFARSLNPQLDVFGAELSPRTFARAKERFASKPNVSIMNAGIAGSTREASISLIPISSSQSLYGENHGEEKVNVKVITPADFVSLNRIESRRIALLKMDIEGAEREVFENFQCVSDVLKNTDIFIIEIHEDRDIPLITRRMESVGFSLKARRQTNYFFTR